MGLSGNLLGDLSLDLAAGEAVSKPVGEAVSKPVGENEPFIDQLLEPEASH